MDEIDADAPVVETGWTDILLMCRKCSKKLNGGFGKDGEETLARAVRKALRARGQRGRIGVIGVPCFGICPKQAVTVARASRPGELLIVKAGGRKESVLF
jgi:predicted metal-binding protein